MLIPNLSDIPDLTTVPKGEYDLKIISVKEVSSERTGRTGTNLTIKILGEENTKNIMHGLWNPMEADDQDKKETMLRMMKEFLQNIGFDLSDGAEWSDLVGHEFSALLDIEVYEGDERNKILRVT